MSLVGKLSASTGFPHSSVEFMKKTPTSSQAVGQRRLSGPNLPAHWAMGTSVSGQLRDPSPRRESFHAYAYEHRALGKIEYKVKLSV